MDRYAETFPVTDRYAEIFPVKDRYAECSHESESERDNIISISNPTLNILKYQWNKSDIESDRPYYNRQKRMHKLICRGRFRALTTT